MVSNIFSTFAADLVYTFPREAIHLPRLWRSRLPRSGITSLKLALNEGTVDFPTQPVLTGNNYAALRAAGWASGDYRYTVTANGVTLTVGDRTYVLADTGELA